MDFDAQSNAYCTAGSPQPEELPEVGRGVGKHEGEWTGRVETRTRKTFLAVGEACVDIF